MADEMPAALGARAGRAAATAFDWQAQPLIKFHVTVIVQFLRSEDEEGH